MNKNDKKFIIILSRRGDIMLVRHSKNEFSNIVAAFDNGPYSHVAAIAGLDKIIESSSHGVAEEKIHKYLTKNHIACIIRPNYDDNKQIDKFINALNGYVGSGYDYGGLIGFGLYYVLKFFGITIKNLFASKYRYICSEVVARSLAKADKKFDMSVYETDGSFELVSPNDFYRMSKSNTDLFKIVYEVREK